MEAGEYQNALEVLAEMPAGDDEIKLLLTGYCQHGLQRTPQARQIADGF